MIFNLIHIGIPGKLPQILMFRYTPVSYWIEVPVSVFLKVSKWFQHAVKAEKLLWWSVAFVVFCLHFLCLIPGFIHFFHFLIYYACSSQSKLMPSGGHCSLCFWNSLFTCLSLNCSFFKVYVFFPHLFVEGHFKLHFSTLFLCLKFCNWLFTFLNCCLTLFPLTM